MTARKASITKRIRPLGTLEILDEVFDAYKSHFVLLIGISSLFYVPYYLFYYAFHKSQCCVVFSMLVIQPLLGIALVYAISEAYLGRKTSVIQCCQQSFSKSVLLPMIGASLVRSPLMLMPMLLAVSSNNNEPSVTGVVLLVFLPLFIIGMFRLLLISPVCVIERTGVKKTLARSWQLMKGNVGKAFWLFFLVLLLYGIFYIVSMQLVYLFPNAGHGIQPKDTIPGQVIIPIVSLLMAPLFTLSSVFLYYDIRVRKEGFDLELLAAQLDAQPQASLLPGAADLPREHVISDRDNQ